MPLLCVCVQLWHKMNAPPKVVTDSRPENNASRAAAVGGGESPISSGIDLKALKVPVYIVMW